MNEFLETYHLLKVNHGKLENLNIFGTYKNIELVLKNLSTKKTPGPDDFTGETCQTFNEQSMPILLSNFQKKKTLEDEEILSN